jgi:hypothetical protein
MAKRKREETSSLQDGTGESRIRRDLSAIIAQGVFRIASSLEQACRIERQRLGKKQHSTNNDTEGTKLNIEIASLKVLDIKELARQRLHKELLKTPSVVKTGMLPEDVKLPLLGQLDRAEVNLRARLFKHKEVGMAIYRTMIEVKEVLGLPSGGRVKKQKLASEEPVMSNGDKGKSTAARPKSRSPLENVHAKAEQSSIAADGSDSEGESQGFSSHIASASGSEDESDNAILGPYTP